jgi:hypothetical protein
VIGARRLAQDVGVPRPSQFANRPLRPTATRMQSALSGPIKMNASIERTGGRAATFVVSYASFVDHYRGKRNTKVSATSSSNGHPSNAQRFLFPTQPFGRVLSYYTLRSVGQSAPSGSGQYGLRVDVSGAVAPTVPFGRFAIGLTTAVRHFARDRRSQRAGLNA